MDIEWNERENTKMEYFETTTSKMVLYPSTEQSANKLNRKPRIRGDQFNETPTGAQGNQERVE